MLYLHLHAIIHNPEKLYLWRDYYDQDMNIDSLKVYAPDEVPADWVYEDADSNKRFNAYNLIVWGRGSFCAEQREEYRFFSLETQKSIGDVISFIDANLNFLQTPELFADWGACRHKLDYCVHVNIYSVSTQLVEAFVNHVLAWVKNNGKYNILEKLPEELQQDLSDTGLRTFTLTTDEILQLERTILYKYKNVSWKIYFPEYEGGGDWAQIVLPAASILIPILADWLGITNPNLAKQRCHDRKMKKCREIILKRYKSILQGELCMPQLQEVRYSSDGREVYRILEMDENGNTIQKYVARIAKKKLRGFKYSIRIEE